MQLYFTLAKRLGKFIISNAPFKQHFEKIGDFDGGPYKQNFQNWQFDVSLLKNVSKIYL